MIKADNINVSNNIEHQFDDLSIQGSVVQAVGWCANLIPEMEGAGDAYLQITDGNGTISYHKLDLTQRNDISQFYGEKQKKNGFSMQISKDKFTGESIEVKVVYLFDDKTCFLSEKSDSLELD